MWPGNETRASTPPPPAGGPSEDAPLTGTDVPGGGAAVYQDVVDRAREQAREAPRVGRWEPGWEGDWVACWGRHTPGRGLRSRPIAYSMYVFMHL